MDDRNRSLLRSLPCLLTASRTRFRLAPGRAFALGAALLLAAPALAQHDHPAPPASPAPVTPVAETADLRLVAASVTHDQALDLLVFEQRVAGTAGGTTPAARGALEGAPVLGYVFPTTLAATDVGFSSTPGTVALAVTSHPDFDDSPLWDENGDGRYDNDGLTWHTHWVVLVEDARVPGKLAVKEFKKADGVVLPPTAPDMPMFMDSPGFAVVARGTTLRVLVPAPRVSGRTDFRYDAVTAYMQVATTGDRPMLGVYAVYTVLSKDLSLPYTVDTK
jgi:hypothetical protein